MKTKKTALILFLSCIISLLLGGCGDKYLDPTQVGRFRPVPAVNVILDTLGVAEETPSTWEGAEDPKPVDIMVFDKDYVFGPGDTVRISIFELLQEGIPFLFDYGVTETGKISIPEVGVVEAVGLTESELEETIRRILSPSILKEPSVAVSLLSSQQRTFTISGNGVPQPNRYLIPRYDFRLLDALAIAGGVSQFNISYVYISREVTGKEDITEDAELLEARPESLEQMIDAEREMLEIIAPRAWQGQTELIVSTTEMVTDAELAQAALPDGFESLIEDAEIARVEDVETIDTEELPAQVVARETIDQPVNPAQAARIEWIFQDGKWVPVQIGQPAPAKKPSVKATEPLEEKKPADYDWEQIGTGGVQRRSIRIPVDKLFGGDYKYNIVVRPGDDIQVPVDIIGEFCIVGNTNFQGFINITGRPMTMKMAVAAAGGLGPLAWPKRCEVVRRIGKKKEEIVMVDLDKIYSGEQPDFFIKPNDLINVGTHPTARWRAVLRNAFRATYGFGFIYDRNFGSREFSLSKPLGPFSL